MGGALMETLKRILEENLAKESVFPQEKLLNTYRVFLDSNCDFFHNNSKILAPISFFGLLFIAKSKRSFEKKEEVVQKLFHLHFFQETDFDRWLVGILEQLESFSNYEVGMLIEFDQMIQSGFVGRIRSKERFKKIQTVLGEKTKILDYVREHEIPHHDFLELLHLYYDCDDVEKNVFHYLSKYIQIAALRKQNIFSSRNDLKPELREICSSSYNIILEYTKKLEREQRNFFREQNSKKKLYQKRLDILEKVTPTDYLEVTEEEIQNFPLSLLETMECIFLEHNEKIMKKLDQESLSFEDNETSFKKLCLKYQIYYTQEDINFIMNSTFSFTELEERLKIFQTLNFSFEKPLLMFFCSSQSVFLFYTQFLFMNVCSVSFFKTYLETLLEPNVVLRVRENYNLFQQLGYSSFPLDSLLLMNSEDILFKKELADMYSLSSYEGIFEPYFFECYDIWIENGLSSYFVKNQMLSHMDLVTITKRILIGLKLGLSIFDDEGKVNSIFLEEKKFFVPDSLLDSYIANHVSIYLKQEKESKFDFDLDSYFMKDPLTYDFDGIFISRPKVLRSGEFSLSSILNGSILNIWECEKIHSILKKKQMERKDLTNLKKSL